MISIQLIMISLTTTRFNTDTWEQHKRWINDNKWKGSIYGTPIRVKEKIKRTMIVLEMHNDKNEIMALGLVKNHFIVSDNNYHIYNDRNYNRYIYNSDYRIVLNEFELLPIEKKIIAIFNTLLFKGACHSKRAQGITEVPSWIMNNKQIDFLKYFKAIFKRKYKQNDILCIHTHLNTSRDQ
jgi:hypothetical protein